MTILRTSPSGPVVAAGSGQKLLVADTQNTFSIEPGGLVESDHILFTFGSDPDVFLDNPLITVYGFVQGTPASGLSYGTIHTALSVDGGLTFLSTPSVPALGWQANVGAAAPFFQLPLASDVGGAGVVTGNIIYRVTVEVNAASPGSVGFVSFVSYQIASKFVP